MNKNQRKRYEQMTEPWGSQAWVPKGRGNSRVLAVSFVGVKAAKPWFLTAVQYVVDATTVDDVHITRQNQSRPIITELMIRMPLDTLQEKLAKKHKPPHSHASEAPKCGPQSDQDADLMERLLFEAV